MEQNKCWWREERAAVCRHSEQVEAEADGRFCVSVDGCGLALAGEQVEEHVLVHVVEGGDVDAEGGGHARHVQPEGLEQLQEVHLFTWTYRLNIVLTLLRAR